MRILCAMDGSESAVRAGRLVAALPLETKDEVVALTVVTPEDGTGGTRASQHSEEALQGTSAQIRAVIDRGHAADRILRTAETEKADLIVVGSRGLTGLTHLLLGSVAEKVTRHSHIPVLIVRTEQMPRKIVLATDGSEGAQHAVNWLRSFPGAAAAEVCVVTVLPFVEDLVRARRLQFPAASADAAVHAWAEQEIASAQRLVERTAETLQEAGFSASARYFHGDPAHQLIEFAEKQQADLIVVGAHGLSAIERFFMGSVSERVLRHAHCSVAVVR